MTAIRMTAVKDAFDVHIEHAIIKRDKLQEEVTEIRTQIESMRAKLRMINDAVVQKQAIKNILYLEHKAQVFEQAIKRVDTEIELLKKMEIRKGTHSRLDKATRPKGKQPTGIKAIRKKLSDLQEKILSKQVDVDIALSQQKQRAYKKQQSEIEKLQELFSKTADKLRSASKLK